MFATLPSAAGRPVLGPALTFGSGAAREARDAPALGEHTREVLAEIGVSAAEADALAAAALPAGVRPERHRRRPTEATFRKTMSETDLILFAGCPATSTRCTSMRSSDAARPRAAGPSTRCSCSG